MIDAGAVLVVAAVYAWLAAVGERVRARAGLNLGADVIERVAREHVDAEGT